MVATRSQKRNIKSIKINDFDNISNDDDSSYKSDDIDDSNDISDEINSCSDENNEDSDEINSNESKEYIEINDETQNESESQCESKKKNKKKIKKKLKKIKIEFVSDNKDTKKSSENDSVKSENEEDDSESEDETNPEDEYLDLISNKLLDDPKSLEKIKKIISNIEKNTPTIEKLLKSPMRKKHRSDLFEWILIYENAMPLSEEKKTLRKQIQNMMEMYIKEYSQYKKHKKELKEFENKFKNYNEHSDIQFKILNLETNNSNKEAIYRKYMELIDKMDEMDDDYYKLKNWINCSLGLPFDRIKKFPNYLNISNYLYKIKSIFDQELYGMERVKEQLLLFIHSKLINPNVKGSCLGLVGDPGVGKTSIARCLAKVLEFPFEQITFGGVNSADFIRGFDYTYVGSRPGEIVRCLTRMNYKNGIIFFDEYEKISQNKDIVSCLLHITDFTQNNSFRDNYLSDLTIDLSSIWFIYSMNSMPEDEALKDRIFYIYVDGYKEIEKINILKDYLLPKQLVNLNLEKDSIQIPENVCKYIVNKIAPNDKGIRNLERSLKDLLNKTSFLVSNQKNIPCSFLLSDKYFPLEYPVIITNDMVDIFLKNFNSNLSTNHLSMYV